MDKELANIGELSSKRGVANPKDKLKMASAIPSIAKLKYGERPKPKFVGITLDPDTYTATNPMLIDKEWEEKMVKKIKGVIDEEAKDVYTLKECIIVLQRIRAKIYREVTEMTYVMTDWVAEKIRIDKEVPMKNAKKELNFKMKMRMNCLCRGLEELVQVIEEYRMEKDDLGFWKELVKNQLREYFKGSWYILNIGKI